MNSKPFIIRPFQHPLRYVQGVPYVGSVPFADLLIAFGEFRIGSMANLLTNLGRAQVYAALAYYHANKQEVDEWLAAGMPVRAFDVPDVDSL